jgi:hypothetical protein
LEAENAANAVTAKAEKANTAAVAAAVQAKAKAKANVKVSAAGKRKQQKKAHAAAKPQAGPDPLAAPQLSAKPDAKSGTKPTAKAKAKAKAKASVKGKARGKAKGKGKARAAAEPKAKAGTAQRGPAVLQLAPPAQVAEGYRKPEWAEEMEFCVAKDGGRLQLQLVEWRVFVSATENVLEVSVGELSSLPDGCDGGATVAGLMEGDVLLEVEATDVRGLPLHEVVDIIANTTRTVTIKVLRSLEWGGGWGIESNDGSVDGSDEENER